MNIPEEVTEAAFGDAWMVAPGKQPQWQRKAATIVAEWARKEALREALNTVERWSAPTAPVALAIRALADGASS